MSQFADNIFYKIIQGDMPAFKVYEDENFVVILDRFPTNLGQCLIIPKTPATDIFDLDDQTAKQIFPLAKRIAAALKAATGCDGVNILQNNGPAADQTVFYFHLHIIPHFKDDDVHFSKIQKNFPDEDFLTMAASVTSKL